MRILQSLENTLVFTARKALKIDQDVGNQLSQFSVFSDLTFIVDGNSDYTPLIDLYSDIV